LFNPIRTQTDHIDWRGIDQGGFAILPEDGPPQQIVVFLHGLHGKGADFAWLAQIWRPFLPAAAFLFPNAICRSEEAPGGHYWWKMSFRERLLRRDADGAAPLLEAFLNRQLDRFVLPPRAMILGGFSQGAMLALHVGARRADRLAGILSYSGMLARFSRFHRGNRSRTPVFLSHGTSDDVVSFAALGSAARILRKRRSDVIEHGWIGGRHTIDPAGARLGGRLMRNGCLGKAGDQPVQDVVASPPTIRLTIPSLPERRISAMMHWR